MRQTESDRDRVVELDRQSGRVRQTESDRDRVVELDRQSQTETEW